MKCDRNSIICIVLIVVLLLQLAGGMDLFSAGNVPAVTKLSPGSVSMEGEESISANIGCAMKGGVGLASSLLPKEVATSEEFGQFAPDDMLAGQNYLDPRNLIGIPETAGGSLRNANQQVRSELPNPRTPVSIFNNSTIVPDQMRATFELGSN